MFGKRWMRRQRSPWAAALGAAAGVATGIALWRVGRRLRGEEGLGPGRGRRAAALEEALVQVLLEDPDLSQRPIEVSMVADGIVELTGVVATDEEAERAVALARRVTGVATVLNRLDSDVLGTHLEATRRRLERGDASLTETHWYGQGIGTGRRRQSLATEPSRPDDRVPIVSRELGVDRAVELTSERLDKIPSGVEGHTTRPAGPVDRGRVQDASHRRLGNVPERGPQDLHPESGVLRELKEAERMRLEEET